ncbi:39S ribosomal protein L45, mitochondrial [Liparis tanakae]|uniref:39S ribosomal protein L45, mitochondrial n=1 Tax=Liparis tanakae TaxID=230148 RepID=A0A4Z2FAB9_9TELE|nr:39S ribosomal protein L45, mitochondrial [Liparis tanakae]
MAAPMRRTLVALHRATCSSLKSAEASLGLRRPAPLYVPVRTKKRYFVPPAASLKRKQQENPETTARTAGIVFRQQIRKIKEFDPQFTSRSFAEKAREIFIEAHGALTQ